MNETWFDKFMDFVIMKVLLPIMILMLIGTLVLIAAMAWHNIKYHNNPCVELIPAVFVGSYHHPAWTQAVMAGKVLVPIYHPEVNQIITKGTRKNNEACEYVRDVTYQEYLESVR